MRAYVKINVCLCLIWCLFFCATEAAQSRKPTPTVLERVVFPEDFDYYQRHNHPEDEDYNDGSRQKPSGANIDDAISNIWGIKRKNTTTINQIPLSFIKEINDKGYTVNDLLLHYVEDYDDDVLENRFGEQERAGVSYVKEAKCMPELRTINLIENKDPSILYIPCCIRVERCGGCCMHDMLECQANETETINVKVVKVKYTGGKTLKYAEKQIVSVDKHKSCKCDCRVRAKDCTPMQVYQKSECRCACRNTDEEKKCQKENSTKLWNPNACACQCREELMCTTGSVFDWRECRCVLKQVRRRNVEVSRRNGYKSYPMSVIPLSIDSL